MSHWKLFSMFNSTDHGTPDSDWESFLHNNSDFIAPLDYLRDMAVESPGESAVLFARYGNYSMK